MTGGLWAHGGTYETWAAFLTEWAAGGRSDGAGLPALRQEDFAADTWDRLRLRLTDALSGRLQRCADALAAALGETADEFSVGRALEQARSGLHPVRALANHPALPEDLRPRLLKMVDDATCSLQQDLERAVEGMVAEGGDPRRVEARRRTVRDNPLTAVTSAPPPVPAGEPAATGGWSYDPTATGRRRVTPP
ncbi:hypothetical protein [Streptomyces sp. 35G-GA-8]|uniref:hypothetical protein n=1 Tax=Streptomyces sp. 35G-GA-8 TaxID=2939434 RepID=UPI00201EC878|nr:hypothetical protein [Streptomyces sp. 35G-GA-8]MCL7380913.1 hypothetical protein [Streptomyces sp. 35G-GA-8]